MAYGTKYKLQFDSDGRTITVNFMFRDFVGSITNVIGAGSPAIQKWNTDDPFDAVRGCSLDLQIFSSSNLSIFDFQTNDDDGVKVSMYYSGGTLFEGFLVQDDFSESVVEYSHVINLSATDNLGLLKDISLSQANIGLGSQNTYTSFVNTFITNGQQIMAFTLSSSLTLTGSTIQLFGTGTNLDNIISIVVSSVETSGSYRLILKDILPSQQSFASASFIIKQAFDFEVKQSLATMFAICLNATNLKFDSDVYMRLQHESSFAQILTQTYIRPEDFKSGTDYSSCYDFIAGVLTAFNACIFQRNGKWVIIRFIELVYGSSFFERFDSNFTSLSVSGAYNGAISYGGNSILAAPLQQILRPLKYVEQKFGYKDITRTIANANFTELGGLKRTLVFGTGVTLQTFKDYFAPKWAPGFWWNDEGTTVVQGNTDYFIRVVTDYKGDEIDRYISISGNPGLQQTSAALVSKYIEVNAGDKIDFSITIRTSNDLDVIGFIPLLINIVTHLPLTPRHPYTQLLRNAQWGEGDPYRLPVSSNLNQWQSFDVKSFEIPVSGRLYVYLPQTSFTGQNYYETHVKGISLKYTPQIAGQRSVKGQVHRDSQFANVKNKKEITLLVDDTLSNAIIGTLFKPPAGLLIDDRTRKWRRDPITEEKKLGEITSIEREFIRSVSRKKIEVSLLDIFKTGFISPYNKITWDRYTNEFFLFGNLEIDYQSNRAKGTLYELYKVGENLTNLHTYTFNYLYE